MKINERIPKIIKINQADVTQKINNKKSYKRSL